MCVFPFHIVWPEAVGRRIICVFALSIMNQLNLKTAQAWTENFKMYLKSSTILYHISRMVSPANRFCYF